MPDWIAQTNMDAQSVAKVKEEMTLLTQWICRNHQRLFINQYERPPQDYIDHARD
jgi:mortality factor 4-like protein 1